MKQSIKRDHEKLLRAIHNARVYDHHIFGPTHWSKKCHKLFKIIRRKRAYNKAEKNLPSITTIK